MSGLDAHERPPEDLKSIFKIYQKATLSELDADVNVISGDNASMLNSAKLIRHIDGSKACFATDPLTSDTKVGVLEWSDLPGLHFIPGLLSETTQRELLSWMLHRDLADKCHQTNIHKHYTVPYELADSPNQDTERSFFNADPTSPTFFEPLDPTIHKPLSIAQFLNKKLRWLTLGGQYDWTAKAYPSEIAPVFPHDLRDLIQSSFPDMEPQAAIVNIYSPGDTLALHRDVSEVSDRGLVSISIGCEAIFIAGLATEQGPSRYRVFRLRSGDAVYMSGASRYAWHGVPRIISGGCPDGLHAWPADDSGRFENWRGWMRTKRINLNVRQMFDD